MVLFYSGCFFSFQDYLCENIPVIFCHLMNDVLSKCILFLPPFSGLTFFVKKMPYIAKCVYDYA